MKLLLSLLIAGPISVYSQPLFNRIDTIPVSEGGKVLKMPWAGGFNACQFSDVDLNMDGINDLFVFDRFGDRKITFINRGTPDSVDYEYSPQYADNFPNLKAFAFLEDYNYDDLPDLLTYSLGGALGTGIGAWRNTSGTSLQFTLEEKVIYSLFINPPKANIFITPYSIPTFTDVDNDGDMDLLLFGFGFYSSYVEYNKNKSMENFGVPDSLDYKVCHQYWGSFRENGLNCGIFYPDTGFGGVVCKDGGHPEHYGGSALLAIDLNGDTLRDLLIGNENCPNLLALYNGGTLSKASITTYDSTFPSYDVPVNLPFFPAPFYVDVNNDGKRDLVVSSNTDVPDSPSIWSGNTLLYNNTGSDSSPVFTFRTNSFLQGEMIEVGSAAKPVIFDFDSDSLPDLLVGNDFYRKYNSRDTSVITVYRNTGTAQQPGFELITRDYMNLSSLGLRALYPAFGDLDGDGDMDMVAGSRDGRFHYFQNSAGPGNPANFVLTGDANIDSLDAGDYASPQLADLNRDGKLDIIAGCKSGVVRYYRNNGTASMHNFVLENDTLGGVNVKRPFAIAGYSMPWIFDDSGNYLLFVGSDRGNIHVYDDIDGNLGGTFSEIDTMLTGFREGGRTAVCIGELTGNSLPEMLVGNYSGGVAWFSSDTLADVGIGVRGSPSIEISVQPNPSPGRVRVRIYPYEATQVSIYDMFGRERWSGTARRGAIILELAGFENGLYLIKAGDGAYATSRKLVIYR